MTATTRRLSQLDAFFVAYQERAGISMQLGVEVDLDARVDPAHVTRAVAALVARWPQLGQLVRRRVFGLRWTGAPDVAAMVASAADHDAAAISRWRNRPIDPFAEPPFQVLHVRRGAGDTLAFRAHHAVADGQSFLACAVAVLEMIGAATAGATDLDTDIAACDRGDVDLLSPRRTLRQAKLGTMVRYARWLVRESRAGRSARLAIRDGSAGDIAVATRGFDAATRAHIWQRARDAGVTPALFVGAAWVRAIGRWNAIAGDGANSLVSLELPISARRGADRTSAVGNFISPLVLFADARAPLTAVAADLRAQVRDGIRDRSYLAMPLLTAPGRYVPWPVFRRMAANTTWSGFATSHYTWVDTITDAHAAIAARSGGVLGIAGQRVYTPVCLHMGAALLAMPWADSLQLFLTHRLNAVTAADAASLLDLVAGELEAP